MFPTGKKQKNVASVKFKKDKKFKIYLSIH